jgi:hypothetical protein
VTTGKTVPEEYRVLRVNLARLVHPDCLVHPVKMDGQQKRAIRATRDRKANPDPQEHPVHRARAVLVG